MTRDEAVRGWLARPALLLFWVLVLWGTLLLLVAGVDAFGEGIRPVVWRLLPPHGASPWAWLNALSAAVAAVVWALAAAALALRLRPAQDPPTD